MTDLLAGSTIKALDTPPPVQSIDTTSISNITDTSYVTGTPENGVTFTAPTTGRVLITVAAGVRNNGANADRVFVTAQVFLGSDGTGTQILAPSVTTNGCSNSGGSTTNDFQYVCRTALLEGLTAGATYYARNMHTTSTGAGTADLNMRQILVTPAT